MFKLAKRHNLEVLEEYGFREDRIYGYYKKSFERQSIIIEKRELKFYDNSEYEVDNKALHLFYKLIKDGIIEEV